MFEKIIAKSVKNEKQALVIESFRVLANCSAQLPQSSLKLVCEASLRNKFYNIGWSPKISFCYRVISLPNLIGVVYLKIDLYLIVFYMAK